MNFILEKARKVAEHYKYLIGSDFDGKKGNHKVTHIAVAPYYSDNLKAFWEHFAAEEDDKRALVLSGYDPQNMLVFVINYDSWSNILVYNEIDKYLTHNNLEKIYLNPDF